MKYGCVISYNDGIPYIIYNYKYNKLNGKKKKESFYINGELNG